MAWCVTRLLTYCAFTLVLIDSVHSWPTETVVFHGLKPFRMGFLRLLCSGKIPARRFKKGSRLEPCKQVDDSVVLLEQLSYISSGNCVLRDDEGNEISSRQDSPENRCFAESALR